MPDGKEHAQGLRNLGRIMLRAETLMNSCKGTTNQKDAVVHSTANNITNESTFANANIIGRQSQETTHAGTNAKLNESCIQIDHQLHVVMHDSKH